MSDHYFEVNNLFACLFFAEERRNKVVELLSSQNILCFLICSLQDSMIKQTVNSLVNTMSEDIYMLKLMTVTALKKCHCFKEHLNSPDFGRGMILS